LQQLTAEQSSRLSSLVKSVGAQRGIEEQQLTGLQREQSIIHVSVIGRNNQVIVRTSDPSVLEEISKLKERIDVPTPQVLLEVKVLSVNLSDGFNSVFDYQFGDKRNAGGFSTGDIEQPTSPSLIVGGNGEQNAVGALNPSSLIYQWVDNNFRVRMQMLQNKDRVTTLATPLLLVANNEVSRVFIGEERPIIQSISSNTTATQGVVSSTPNTSFTFRPVGTTLLITPNINADRTVTLRLIQETSSIISGGASIPVVSGNGNVTNEPVDVVSAKSLTGTLIAKDGLSLALGGLIEENLTDNREEIPVLGELPYVGLFFRRQSTGRERDEVIIVIRPFVLSTPSEAEAVGRQLVDANSIHPKIPELNPAPGLPIGSMNSYLPNEVLRANPPRNQLQKIFHFHDVLPRTY
jgi:general secretion pathway protein D